MEDAAKKFEQEDDILCKTQQQYANGDDLFPLFNNLPTAEQDGYTPYCKINLYLNQETAETQDLIEHLEYTSHREPFVSNGDEIIGTEASDASLASAASTLCSFLESVENNSISINVSFGSFIHT